MRINTMPWDKDFDAEEFRKECQQKKSEHSLRGMSANERGQLFEKQILTACEQYRLDGIAYIAKIPEPFRVMRKLPAGRANVQFMRHAEPDFMGVWRGGRNIVFEAKYTIKDKISENVLTSRQHEALEYCWRLRARAGVCCGVQDKYYFVPWAVWRDMKRLYGRHSMSKDDLEPYEVKYDGMQVKFLEYKDYRKIVRVLDEQTVKACYGIFKY